jgi:hypothetical protein
MDNMSDADIEKLARRVAELVVEALAEGHSSELGPEEWIFTLDDDENEEQALLAELAQLMTQLDYNLQIEEYSKCETIKKNIITVENKLKKFK